jgi:succinoglycan biosynthesis protein ExoL
VTQLIFFGHDAHDAALQRRIASFARVGADVLAFTMRRGDAFETPWRNVDLGRTHDAAFRQRLTALARAAPLLKPHRDALKRADVLYARNLDMLALARWAKVISGSRAKLVYECLDIHRFMPRADALGMSLRAAERALLADVSLVVTSSPAFVREYFAPRHGGHANVMVIENRLPSGFDYGPRPEPRASGETLRIGWFGNLRCRRSLALLLEMAQHFGPRVEIVMRGAPARTELPDFEARIAGRENVRFGGRYAWPADLSALYRDVDVVWAGDFHDPSANSRWLLPNRLYEGGYHGAVPIAPADSETGRWIEARGFGFTIAEPVEQSFAALIDALKPSDIADARARVLAAPADVFVAPADEMSAVLTAALGGAKAP